MDLTGTVKAERISFQWMETSANGTDSARQAHMIAWAISTPRASHPVTQNKAPGNEDRRDGIAARCPLAMQRDFAFVCE